MSHDQTIATLNAQIKYAEAALSSPVLSPSHEAAMEWVAVRDRLLTSLWNVTQDKITNETLRRAGIEVK